MTNQRTERLRSGRTPGRRGSGYGRGIGLGLILLGLLASAAPIQAAEVVEVRVGRHPEFTRVVFELDRAAGYRIERSDPNAKTAELIISLEAGSIPRRIQSSKSFIEQVVVEPNGTRSIARIRLARGGLRLKEMILASPPRIVLDVISEDGATTASSTVKAATRPVQSASTTPTPAQKPTAAPVAPKPAPAPAPVAPKPTAVVADAAPAVKPATAAPQTRVLASTEDPNAKTPSAAPAPAADAPGADAIALAAANAAADGGTNGSGANEWNDGGAASGSDGSGDPDAGASASDTPTAQPSEPAAAEAPKARPMMVKSTKSEEGGGLMTWALAGAGLAVVAFGGLVVARRRAASAAGDEYEDDDEDADDASDEEEQDEEAEGEDEEEEESSTSASRNPFAELTGGSASLAAGTTRGSASPSRAADQRENEPSESLLFDDAEEKTMEGMEVISRSQANEGLGGAMPMMGAGSDEITQMFREMQRRVAALEGRIDELVDARDRLERQVAAQTEELRVQRAAIARTQRAVRNLARPEEGNDDEPTEPALREPN
ncbi:MAG: hypothetical protein R3F21_10285 [Myxococcota bacterium]